MVLLFFVLAVYKVNKHVFVCIRSLSLGVLCVETHWLVYIILIYY